MGSRSLPRSLAQSLPRSPAPSLPRSLAPCLATSHPLTPSRLTPSSLPPTAHSPHRYSPCSGRPGFWSHSTCKSPRWTRRQTAWCGRVGVRVWGVGRSVGFAGVRCRVWLQGTGRWDWGCGGLGFGHLRHVGGACLPPATLDNRLRVQAGSGGQVWLAPSLSPGQATTPNRFRC